ncbi:TPA: hypothetical protein TXT59_000132 [Streptococcus suis]|nr:hypothetical protein [Streptococcus suis]HEL1733163.1 hypothetical protein [Streptococcus suis]
MSKFKVTEFENQDYGIAIAELVKDIYYSGVSTSSKLVLIRKFTELISRKILNMGVGVKMTLGEIAYPNLDKFPRTYKLLQELDETTRDDLTLIVREISELCNQYAHTQISKIASDKELAKAEALISELFSLLFVKYFIEFKITFSTAPEVLSTFSHLPPVIRFNALKRLIDNQIKENIMPNLQLLDKFILAKIKYQSWEETYSWFLENREFILQIPYPSDAEIEDYIRLRNGLCSLPLLEYDNVFELLLNKLLDPRIKLNESGRLYDTFEESVIYFRYLEKDMNLIGTEEKEVFKDIIEFSFMGR